MQKVKLDIEKIGQDPTIYVKQGDVKRKFVLELYQNGSPYIIHDFAEFSVWYSGPSGEGNYTKIGEKDACITEDNKIEVEMIAEMLLLPGDHRMCVIASDAVDGEQIGFWNVRYVVQEIPGANSEEAKKYYHELANAVERAETAAKEAVESAEKVNNPVSYEKQNPTEEQKAQARANIGALSTFDLDESIDPIFETMELNYVSVSEAQDFDDEQKAQARENIGAISESVTRTEDVAVNQKGYYLGIKGELTPNPASGLWSGYIKVKPGDVVCGNAKSTGTLAIYAFYDGSYTFLSGYLGNGTKDYEDYQATVPVGAKYVAFSTLDKWTCEAHIKRKDYVATEEYVDGKFEEVLADKFPKHFYVGYDADDGKQYFASLVECLYAVAATEGEKVVHINDGTYDVLEELGGMEYVLSKSTTDYGWRDVQPVVTDTTIIGEGHVVLLFHIAAGTSYSDHGFLFSCLNVSGNTSIENIEIHSSNCRYSIHDESSTLYPNTVRRYKNVRCYQNKNGTTGGQAVGCGFSEGTNVHYDNCVLMAKTEVWTCHAYQGCTFAFNNTVMKSYSGSATYSLRISQTGNTELYANIANCYLGAGLMVSNTGEEVSTKPDVTRIDLINTKVANLVNGYADIVEPITSYDTINGTETVLLAPTA